MAEEKKNKRYFWLKLENTYFKRLDQRKMCKQKNGYDMQRIYLKMMQYFWLVLQQMKADVQERLRLPGLLV